VTERMHFEELVGGDICHTGLSRSDLEDVARAFEKVVDYGQTLL